MTHKANANFKPCQGQEKWLQLRMLATLVDNRILSLASAWCLTTIYKSSTMLSNILFWSPKAMYMQVTHLRTCALHSFPK